MRRRKKTKPSWGRGRGMDPLTEVGGGNLFHKDVPRKHRIHHRERKVGSTLSGSYRGSGRCHGPQPRKHAYSDHTSTSAIELKD